MRSMCRSGDAIVDGRDGTVPVPGAPVKCASKLTYQSNMLARGTACESERVGNRGTSLALAGGSNVEGRSPVAGLGRSSGQVFSVA